MTTNNKHHRLFLTTRQRELLGEEDSRRVLSMAGVIEQERDTALAEVRGLRAIVSALADSNPIMDTLSGGVSCAICGAWDEPCRDDCAWRLAKRTTTESR